MSRRVDLVIALLVVIALRFIFGYFIAAELPGGGKEASTLKMITLHEGSALFSPDNQYFENLVRLLDMANESVYVALYVVKYDPKQPNDPVNQLLEKLVELKNRGVDVKIVVDDTTWKSYGDTISFLKTHGARFA